MIRKHFNFSSLQLHAAKEICVGGRGVRVALGSGGSGRARAHLRVSDRLCAHLGRTGQLIEMWEPIRGRWEARGSKAIRDFQLWSANGNLSPPHSALHPLGRPTLIDLIRPTELSVLIGEKQTSCKCEVWSKVLVSQDSKWDLDIQIAGL